jgi:uracil-DNA glycosylase
MEMVILLFCDEKIEVDNSWNKFLTTNIKDELKEIENSIGDEFTPTPKKALRFLSIDLNDIKYIILGEDPYPQKGVATGRAFEVSNVESCVESWQKTSINASLKNILKLIHKHQQGNSKVKSIAEVRKEIKDKSFKMLPPDKIFDHWEKEGVLFLNTAFTCEIGKSGSHRLIWSCFTKKLINFISSYCSNLTWCLLGNHAAKFEKFISNEAEIITCAHPRLYGTEKNDFLGSDCFKNDNIDWCGIK